MICHAEPKAKHLGSGLIVRSPDSSLHSISLRITRRPIFFNRMVCGFCFTLIGRFELLILLRLSGSILLSFGRLPFQVFPDQLNLSFQPYDLCFVDIHSSGPSIGGPSYHPSFAFFVELDDFLQDIETFVPGPAQVHFRAHKRYVCIPVLVNTGPA